VFLVVFAILRDFLHLAVRLSNSAAGPNMAWVQKYNECFYILLNSSHIADACAESEGILVQDNVQLFILFSVCCAETFFCIAAVW